MKAPKLWKNLENITISTLESPWYCHIANLENVIAAAFFCDLCSNIFETFLAALLKNNAMPGPDIIQKLFMIA